MNKTEKIWVAVLIAALVAYMGWQQLRPRPEPAPLPAPAPTQQAQPPAEAPDASVQEPTKPAFNPASQTFHVLENGQVRLTFSNLGARLVRVELPLAMPVIIAGLRMATIYTVSWAVLASMIGLGGLGNFVYRGTSSNNNTLILLGAIPAALLAILFGAVIDLLQKKVTPRGLRKEAGK